MPRQKLRHVIVHIPVSTCQPFLQMGNQPFGPLTRRRVSLPTLLSLFYCSVLFFLLCPLLARPPLIESNSITNKSEWPQWSHTRPRSMKFCKRMPFWATNVSGVWLSSPIHSNKHCLSSDWYSIQHDRLHHSVQYLLEARTADIWENPYSFSAFCTVSFTRLLNVSHPSIQILNISCFFCGIMSIPWSEYRFYPFVTKNNKFSLWRGNSQVFWFHSFLYSLHKFNCLVHKRD